MFQLELFPIDPLLEVRRELARVEESGHRVRKGTYAAINKIGKAYCEQELRIQNLEHKLYVLEKCLMEKL